MNAREIAGGLSRAQRKAIRRANAHASQAATSRKKVVFRKTGTRRSQHAAFISYAGEDRDKIAKPLSEALARRGWTSWLAEREMRATGSPRSIIDRGLREARFGVVVLSRSYFGKFWPEAELDALLAREERTGEKVVVPVLHEITRDELGQLSPIMAGRMTINAKTGVERTADEVSRSFKKELGVHPTRTIADLPAFEFEPVDRSTFELTPTTGG